MASKKGEKKHSFLERSFSAPQISKRKQFIQGFPYTNPSKMPKYLCFFFLRKSMDFNDSKKKVSGFEPQNSGRADGF